jgi:GntR family transcriptional repressor for pyruvate dehydrogenase complex
VCKLRQPRLAEIVAASLRDDILSGRLQEGELLPRQEHLLREFGVSLPAVREAMRILETQGLISVQRGNVGGAIVHRPTPERTARIVSMVLQVRQTTLDDVSRALLHLEPVCAQLCAARPDRMTAVAPALRAVIDAQRAQFTDVASYNVNARRFHEALVAHCGNETMIVVVGSLEAIWSAQESSVWDEDGPGAAVDSPQARMADQTRRAALRDHEKILAAIEGGNAAGADALLSRHLAATGKSTLESSRHATISASLGRENG